MANFDQNKWYQISTPSGGLSFVGSPDVLKDGKTTVQPYGAVFLRTSNSTDREQQWQLYPVNETTLVLRTRASGPSNYMGTAIDFGAVGTVNGGNTKPIMGNHTLMDASVLWSINAWGDGLFYFENAQNGSAWHLNHTGSGYFDMSSNITAPQDEQSFTFKAVGNINNQKFSTIDMPGATATAAPRGTSTMNSNKKHSSDSGGLSTGAKAAIGASIGGAVLIIALVVALLWMRRRRKRGTMKSTVADPPYTYTPVHETSVISELPGRGIEPSAGKGAAAPAMDSQKKESPVELENNGPPAELPGDSHRW